ncbi:MAG: hypothetical protein IPG93_24575 [Burkholderiales bacterium]|nr:hypothetical protein [Burkholderiales bacterium]
MKERPILFSAPMVRALLEGTKTQTRRPVKPQPPADAPLIYVGRYAPALIDRRGEMYPGEDVFGAEFDDGSDGAWCIKCPYGAPGDRLWVKETIRLLPEFEPESEHAVSEFSADGEITKADAWPWKRRVLPSIHMPRGLSRITLEITEVRVERLCRISDDDARAEGVEKTSQRGWRDYGLDLPNAQPHAPGSFASLWGSINGIGSWSANPWVWVLTFKRVTP